MARAPFPVIAGDSSTKQKAAVATADGSLADLVALVTPDGVDISPTNPLAVQTAAVPATLTDRSGAITTGGTAQTAAAANPTRRGFLIQNNSAGDMRVNPKGAASATAGILLPGGRNALYEFPASGVPTTAISVWGATAAQAYEASEW